MAVAQVERDLSAFHVDYRHRRFAAADRQQAVRCAPRWTCSSRRAARSKRRQALAGSMMRNIWAPSASVAAPAFAGMAAEEELAGRGLDAAADAGRVRRCRSRRDRRPRTGHRRNGWPRYGSRAGRVPPHRWRCAASRPRCVGSSGLAASAYSWSSRRRATRRRAYGPVADAPGLHAAGGVGYRLRRQAARPAAGRAVLAGGQAPDLTVRSDFQAARRSIR